MNAIYTETYEVKTKSPLTLFPREIICCVCSLMYIIKKKKLNSACVCTHTCTYILFSLKIQLFFYTQYQSVICLLNIFRTSINIYSFNVVLYFMFMDISKFI